MSTATVRQSITLERLTESPFNPRKIFNDATLDELAASIKAEGILQRPLVRPIVGAGDRFEIVFGHRRIRAAERAGLTSVDCDVRAMTDAEASRAQIAENLARDDVHAIEEAEGFAALMNAHGVTIDQLVEQTGKSRTYVYNRLKLLDAVEPIRQACLEGKFGAEVLQLFARLPARLQPKALEIVRADYHVAKGFDGELTDGGAFALRKVREILLDKFTLELKGVIWKLDDAQLLPDAGACTTCPKRSGSSPEIFADIISAAARPWRSATGPNTCTDPDCFAAKKKQQLANDAATLAKKSGPAVLVVTGNKAKAAIDAQGKLRSTSAYVALASVKAELGKARANAKRDSKIVPPQVVAIQDQRTGKIVQAVARAELLAAGVKVAAPKPKADGYAEREAAYKAERALAAEKIAAELQVRRQLLEQIRTAAAAAPRSAFDLRLVAHAALAGVAYRDLGLIAELWNAKDDQAVDKKIDGLELQDLGRFVLDCALVRDLAPSYVEACKKLPQTLQSAAQHYGVALARPAKVAPTPSPAARATPWAATTKKSATAARAPAKGKAPAAAPKGKGKALRADQKDDAGDAGESDAQVRADLEAAGQLRLLDEVTP